MMAIPPACEPLCCLTDSSPAARFQCDCLHLFALIKPFDKQQGRCYIQANETKGASLRPGFPAKKTNSRLRL